MAGSRRFQGLVWVLPVLAMFVGEAVAETCTSVQDGNWNTTSTWSCTGGVTRPGAADDVVIVSPHTVTLDGTRWATNLQIKAGATLDGNNKNLTVNSGAITISGTYNTAGGNLTTTGGGSLTIDAGGIFNFNNGNASIGGDVVVNGTLTSGGDAIQMTGANTTVSGTGTISNTDFEIDASGISLPVGSTLEFSNGAQLRVGNNNTASFTLDGTITGFGMAAGDRIVRVYQNSGMTINGTINAPNTYIRIEQNAAITNNGTVSVQYLRTDAVTSVWTQGNNSNLTLSVNTPAGDWNGVLNALAVGNTVTFNGTATPFDPATYYNIGGSAVTCPLPAGITVLGTSPCAPPPGSTSVTANPTVCINDAGIGSQTWGTLSGPSASDNSYATASITNSQITNYLKCTGYNFSIPSNATITGIALAVENHSQRTINDFAAQLVKGGVIQPTNYATNTRFPAADAYTTYGGASDLWGGVWTVADINNANFGVAFAAQRGPYNSPDTAFVDHMPVTVTYTLPSFPSVLSIDLADVNPTNTGTSVNWTVTFNQIVTGVNAADFVLVPGGGVSGETITAVTGSGANWTVTANVGSGTGTLGLNLVDDDSIVDSGGLKLGGTGAGNGNFTGQVYTVEAPMACVMDSFSTGTLDSTLWSVRTIMGAFTPQVVNVGGGDYRLRLTNTVGNEATFAQLKRTFPGAGNKVVLEIDYFAYGGSGADGIAVTFSDSTVSSTTGGFGGSLGYAPNGTNDGFGGGWLGIGLDEWGNFPNPTEGRSGYPAGWTAPVTANTAAGLYKTNVSVRGSGNAQTGYALLANTGVLATAVAPPTGAAGDTPYRFRITLDHSDNVHAYVTVERDTTGTGNSYAILVPKFDVKAANSGQAAVPANWLVSFTGSTGGSTNNHDFKRVKVCANTILGGGPHHFEITHTDGQGVTCTPSTLTIKACADATCATPYTAGVSGTLSATGTPTVNWGGGSNAFTIAAGSSSATKDIQVATVGSVVLDVASTPAPSSATTCSWGACTFTSADSALLVSAPNHLAESASTLTIRAVKSAPGNPLVCVPGMTGDKTVNLKCGYTNPASGTQAVRVGGTALNAGNDAAAACDAGGANVGLTFNPSGIATPSLQYADVGKMSVSANYTGTAGSMDAGLVMTGSGSFITAPASFSVTGVTAGPIIADNLFSATVTALNAVGDVTPNFGNEDAPEGTTLSSVLAMGAGTWVNPALGGTTAILGTSFVDGAATVSDLTWAEVGAINLNAALTGGNYLTSGLTTASGSTATSTTFIPDHYTTEIVSAGGLPMTCPDASCPVNPLGASGMVYSGQPFTVKVTAKNPAGTTTTNYQGAYAQDVTLSGGATGTLSNPLLLASNFTLGEGTTTSLPAFTFTAAGPAAPADIQIHATGTGVSATAQSSGTDESALKIAYGRIKLPNAYGSELLPLTLDAIAQYYGTSGWTKSLTDNVTILGLAANYAVGTGSTTPTPLNGAMSGGKLSVSLSKPGVEGVATIMPSAHPYMGLVAGKVTFGVYKGNREFIYQREAY